MLKPQFYTEVYNLKISKEQKQTLDKLKLRNVKVATFVREAINEKLQREHKNLIAKPKAACPF